MAKIKKAFFCQNCGVQSPKWLGKCPSCNEWNTFVEEIIQSSSETKSWENKSNIRNNKPLLISEINLSDEMRINSNNIELNRVLGGGIVPGSVVLIGGEPGIGKSTLMLQVALNLNNLRVLYISGEESEQQIKMRAERIGSVNKNCYVFTETSTQNIFAQINEVNPNIVIIDSIQTLTTSVIESSAGSVSQIRECTSEMQRFAKQTDTPVFLIGHITKDGSLAGPKV